MYLNDWKNKEEMMNAFEISADDLRGAKILFANYNNGGWEGDAFVLFARDGKLYEVNGSHCSCYGLEGQWEPEETTKEALLHRIKKGTLGSNVYEGFFADELIKVLKKIKE